MEKFYNPYLNQNTKGEQETLPINNYKKIHSNDFANGAGRTLGTVNEITKNVATGIAGFAEGIVDFGAMIGSSFAKMFGLDEASKDINKFIENQWSDDVGNFIAQNSITGLIGKGAYGVNNLYDYSYTNELDPKVRNILTGVETAIGDILPTIAIGSLTGGATLAAKGADAANKAAKVASLGSLGISAAGGGSQEALSEGADAIQALGYGALSGVSEVAIEKISSLIPGLDAIPGLKKFSSASTGNRFVKLLGTMVSEGLEEGVSDIVNPAWKALTYTGKYTAPQAQELLTDVLVGGLAGGIVGGVSNIRSTNKKATASVENLENVIQQESTNFKQANEDLKNGTITQEQHDEIIKQGQGNIKTAAQEVEKNVKPEDIVIEEKPLESEKAQEQVNVQENVEQAVESPESALNENIESKPTEDINSQELNTEKVEENINQTEDTKPIDEPKVEKPKKVINSFEGNLTSSIKKAIANDFKKVNKKSLKGTDYDINIEINRPKNKFGKKISLQSNLITKDVSKMDKPTLEMIAKDVYNNGTITIGDDDFQLSDAYSYEEFEKVIEKTQLKLKSTAKVSDYYKELYSNLTYKVFIDKEIAKVKTKINKLGTRMIKKSKSNKGVAKPYNSEPIRNWVKAIGEQVKNKSFSTKIRESLTALNKAYVENSNFTDENGDVIPGMTSIGIPFNQQIKDMMERIADGEGTLNLGELMVLEDIVKTFDFQLRNIANNIAYVNGHNVEMDKKVPQYDEIIKKNPKFKLGFIKKYYMGTLDPDAFFSIVDNFNINGQGFFTDMVDILRNSYKKECSVNDKFTKIETKFNENHKNYAKRLREKVTLKFGDQSVTTTRDDLMSLYLTSRTDGGLDRIGRSGFHIATDNGKVSEKIHHANIDVDSFQDYLKSFMNESDDAFVEYVDKVMETAKEFKTETDMNLLGISNIIDGIYYPTQVYDSNFSKDYGNLANNFANQRTLSNLSFNKSRRASIGSFGISKASSTLRAYENGIARYYAYATDIDYINRALNLTINNDSTNNKRVTLRVSLDQKGYQKEFWTYLNNFLADVQGIGQKPQMTGIDKAISAVRKNSVVATLGLNLSSSLKQVSAYMAAITEVSPKSMLKALLSPKSSVFINKTRAFLASKSPLLAMRFQDNAISQSNAVTETLNKAQSIAMKPLQLADDLTVCKMFEAAKYDAKSKYGYEIGSEENTQKAIEITETLVQKTQPNFNAVERSGWQRSNSEFTKSLMMYMSQVTKNASRLISSSMEANATRKALRNKNLSVEDRTRLQNKLKSSSKYAAKMGAVVISQGALESMIMVLVNALIHKKDLDENDPNELLTDIIENSTINMFPVVKDLYGKLIHDYDVKIGAFDGINNLLGSSRNLVKGFSDMAQGKYVNWKSNTYDLTKDVSEVLLGIPFENVTEDLILGLGLKNFDPELAVRAENIFYDTSLSETTSNYKHALETGRMKQATAYLKGSFANYKTGSEPSDKIIDEINKLYKNGYINVMPKSINRVIQVNGEPNEISANELKSIRKYYSMANDVVEDVITDYNYKRLDDTSKSKLIKKVYDAYYEYAKEKSIKGYVTDNQLAQLIEMGNDISETIMILEKVKTFKTDTLSTRKEKVFRYINRRALSKKEKQLIFKLAGFSSKA